MNSSSNQWYVQTDFGALLGPMPTDALSEMARTGALLRRDQVRDGADGVWRLASDWPELFDSPPLTSAVADPLEEPPSPRESQKIASNARMLDELLKTGNENNAPRPTGGSATLAEELEFEIDRPIVAPAAAQRSSPVTAARAEPMPAPTAKPAAPLQSPAIAIPLEAPPSPAEPPPRPLDRREDWEPASVPAVRRLPRVHVAADRKNLARRWWKATGAAVVLGLLATMWWVWPRQRPDIYRQYVSIYEELQQRQGNAKDRDGWNQFTARAKAQLDESIPWLEDKAAPGDREKSLLLYAGRDLQVLLEHPQESQSAQQRRLGVFLEQLAEMYGSRK